MAGTGLRCGRSIRLHVRTRPAILPIFVTQYLARTGSHVKLIERKQNRDFEPALAEMLREHLGGRVSGEFFQTRNGTPFSRTTFGQNWSVLNKLGLKRGGLHAFRHGRYLSFRKTVYLGFGEKWLEIPFANNIRYSFVRIS